MLLTVETIYAVKGFLYLDNNRFTGLHYIFIKNLNHQFSLKILEEDWKSVVSLEALGI